MIWMSGVGINPLYALPSPNCPRTRVEGNTVFPSGHPTVVLHWLTVSDVACFAGSEHHSGSVVNHVYTAITLIPVHVITFQPRYHFLIKISRTWRIFVSFSLHWFNFLLAFNHDLSLVWKVCCGGWEPDSWQENTLSSVLYPYAL